MSVKEPLFHLASLLVPARTGEAVAGLLVAVAAAASTPGLGRGDPADGDEHVGFAHHALHPLKGLLGGDAA
jgi:hypothetical protein